MKKNIEFILLVSLFLGGIAVFVGGHLYQAAQYKKKEAEKKQYVVEFYDLKNQLETCQNKTKDQDIKFASFEMLLSHTIHRDVPHDRIRAMIKKCNASIVT
jgi:hypothetical protein